MQGNIMRTQTDFCFHILVSVAKPEYSVLCEVAFRKQIVHMYFEAAVDS